MKLLPNGCRCSELTVHPKNWKTNQRSASKAWYIFYRFYDYSGAVKLVHLRGMNHLSAWVDRVKATEDLLSEEISSLLDGMNPITKMRPVIREKVYEIEPKTHFCDALTMVIARLKIQAKTKQEITSMLVHVEQAAQMLLYRTLPVCDIRRKHIRAILEQIEYNKRIAHENAVAAGAEKVPKYNWSANTFNHYRKYLSVLFKELVEVEACEFNPVTAISKQKTVTRIRETLSPKQRQLINDHLQTHYNRFWLFMQIFFHSGARTTELLKVKAQDVNLEAQYVKITIIKGKARREVKKVIKDVAIQYWQQALQWTVKNVIYHAQPEDYVFSIDLLPGPHLIRAEQISRRWRLHVKAKPETPDAKHKTKGGLGINVDFYSLKHLHSDQVAAELGLQAAGQHNSHTSTSTTMIYAVNERERQAEKLKKLSNKFA